MKVKFKLTPNWKKGSGCTSDFEEKDLNLSDYGVTTPLNQHFGFGTYKTLINQGRLNNKFLIYVPAGSSESGLYRLDKYISKNITTITSSITNGEFNPRKILQGLYWYSEV